MPQALSGKRLCTYSFSFVLRSPARKLLGTSSSSRGLPRQHTTLHLFRQPWKSRSLLSPTGKFLCTSSSNHVAQPESCFAPLPAQPESCFAPRLFQPGLPQPQHAPPLATCLKVALHLSQSSWKVALHVFQQPWTFMLLHNVQSPVGEAVSTQVLIPTPQVGISTLQ
jgi:hypothetical protein